jgi:hypothetical protein
MKGMSPEQKEQLKQQIQGIRDNLKANKEAITEVTKSAKEQAKVNKESQLDTAWASIRGQKKKKNNKKKG